MIYNLCLKLKGTSFKSGILAFITCILATGFSFAQQGAYFDPALAYNRLLVEKNNGTYTQVGNYKVVGSPYLYGEKNKGDIFAATETGSDVRVSYNTYNQEVNFYPSNSSSPLTKEPGTLDSFRLRQLNDDKGTDQLSFVYGRLLGSSDKSYYQVVARGKNVNLYKKYSSELALVTTNIIQSELRQFNILVDYYYTDSTNKAIKKLKVSVKNLTKEFAYLNKTSISINADELVSYKEQELVKLFAELNR